MQLKKLSIRPSKILLGLVAVAYPIAVFVALQHGVGVRMMGLGLIFIALVALARRQSIWIAGGGIVLAVMAMISNSEIFVKLYPVVMNAAVCLMFVSSLKNVPLVQRFAEKMGYEMNDKSRRYARRVTVAWGILMGINTVISLATVFMSDWVWTLYNGMISYCLIGTMIVGEYLVRLGAGHEHK